jgi:hypothetical protein
MATDYFSDNEAFIVSQPLPTPAGTPYMTSRRSSRYGTPASEVPSSPPPLPPSPYPDTDYPGNETEDGTTNSEAISILDPRRFTPTLHANLVSEILNLRRELDSKHRFIEDVETNLYAARTENDSLMKQLSSSAKDNRTAKRQLQHFENEMLATLEEIAGERDKLKDVNADLKTKLEVAEKRSRSQDDDSTRVHDMWAREKETWAGEKRTLGRKVHISEARLKLLLDELAAHEAVREDARVESEDEDAKDGAGAESDTTSVRSSPQRRSSTRIGRHSRNLSNSSYRSIGRNYRMSLLSNEGHNRGNGLSLADELIFDEEEEDLDELELDSDDFPEHEMRARRILESSMSLLSCRMKQPSRQLRLHPETSPWSSHRRSQSMWTQASSPRHPHRRCSPPWQRPRRRLSMRPLCSRSLWKAYRSIPSWTQHRVWQISAESAHRCC